MTPSATNWFNLPFELKSNILSRIGPRDIIENAQEVCKDWFQVCKDPSMWKVINMANSFPYFDLRTLTNMSKYVVNRSQGQLVDIVIPRLPTDEVLLHVAERSSQLKRLTMTCFLGDPSNKSLVEALKKFPLLEELIVYSPDFSKEAIESAGRYCPLLKTLIVDQEPMRYVYSSNTPLNDEIALAVGENLQGLRHLKLIRNGITNNGLKVLMDGCRQLESLDLSLCWNIDLKEDIVKRCSEQIKRLTLPQRDACGSTQSDDLDYDYDPYNPYYGELAYADGGLTESDDDDLTGLYTNYYTL